MAQIKPEPEEVIQSKLQKIRCCTGCLNNINYLVFGHGLYCPQCISIFPDLTQDHFINLEGLSKLLFAEIKQYQQRSKGEVNQINLIKGQMQALKKDVNSSKQTLVYDARTVKEKSLATLNELYTQCLKQNQNQPLEGIYQPDITVSLILNESQLLLQNLQNLTIKEQGDKIEYKLVQAHKKPEKINKKIEKEYKQLQNLIESAEIQCKGIIDNFMKSIKQ